jgi:hypothetical protein
MIITLMLSSSQMMTIDVNINVIIRPDENTRHNVIIEQVITQNANIGVIIQPYDNTKYRHECYHPR